MSRRSHYCAFRIVLALVAASLLQVSAIAQETTSHGGWPFVGNDLRNTRSADQERRIGTNNIARLQKVWSATLAGDVQSNVVSDGPALFVSTSLGHLYRINRASGRVDWDIELPAVLGIPGASSKGVGLGTHAVVFGVQKAVAAVDKKTGALLWKMPIEDHPVARISQPPIVFDGRVFIGVASGEEAAAVKPDYKCCGFRGNVLALDEATGKILWRTYVVPEGFAGGAIWSRTPSVDVKRGFLYITTGNLYQAPKQVEECANRNKDNPEALNSCYPPGVWNDSILALNPATGEIKWGHRGESYDIFTGACMRPELGAPFCGGGADLDFGNGAMLWHVKGPSGGYDLVGAGQKSGVFWALNPDTGKVVWQRRVGPGGANGGLQQGSATDGTRVYTALSNAKQINQPHQAYALPSGNTIKYGSFAALDAKTGRIIWQIADPGGVKSPGNDNPCSFEGPRDDCSGAFPRAPVSIANGVMFACSGAPMGSMYAFDGATGKVLWTFDTGGSCRNGAAIIDSTVYWGTGTKLHAFKVPQEGGRKISAVRPPLAPFG